jgi:3-hydroxyisobutyrate dehydrogenase-like beta-hydroxyacid dehydrogenase
MATQTSDLQTGDGPRRAIAVAVVGLGEAGAAIAADLAEAGCAVRAWDVDPGRRAAAGAVAEGVADAVRGADLVISLVTAAGARAVVSEAAPALAAGVVFADLNTTGVGLKRDLAEAVEATGARFADVAVMAPVPGLGLRTPLLASGGGAKRFAELVFPFGARVEVLAGGPGAAAGRKLVRSVFVKGLAAALLEADAAAHAAGFGDWLRSDAAATLSAADERLVVRLLEGSRAHAERRVHELSDAAALLRELGVEPRVTEAARDVLRELEQ